MRNSTTIDKEIFKWPVCLMLAFIAKYYHATDRHLGRAFLMTKDEVFGESSGSAKLILNQSSQ